MKLFTAGPSCVKNILCVKWCTIASKATCSFTDTGLVFIGAGFQLADITRTNHGDCEDISGCNPKQLGVISTWQGQTSSFLCNNFPCNTEVHTMLI